MPHNTGTDTSPYEARACVALQHHEHPHTCNPCYPTARAHDAHLPADPSRVYSNWNFRLSTLPAGRLSTVDTTHQSGRDPSRRQLLDCYVSGRRLLSALKVLEVDLRVSGSDGVLIVLSGELYPEDVLSLCRAAVRSAGGGAQSSRPLTSRIKSIVERESSLL